MESAVNPWVAFDAVGLRMNYFGKKLIRTNLAEEIQSRILRRSSLDRDS